MPAVPPVFVWRHAATSTALLAMVEPNYGTYVQVPGSADVLLFMYAMDNSGVPTAAAVLSFWNETRARFPGATLLASTVRRSVLQT